MLNLCIRLVLVRTSGRRLRGTIVGASVETLPTILTRECVAQVAFIDLIQEDRRPKSHLWMR